MDQKVHRLERENTVKDYLLCFEHPVALPILVDLIPPSQTNQQPSGDILMGQMKNNALNKDVNLGDFLNCRNVGGPCISAKPGWVQENQHLSISLCHNLEKPIVTRPSDCLVKGRLVIRELTAWHALGWKAMEGEASFFAFAATMAFQLISPMA